MFIDEGLPEADPDIWTLLYFSPLSQARQLLEKEYNSLITMGTERRPDEVS